MAFNGIGNFTVAGSGGSVTVSISWNGAGQGAQYIAADPINPLDNNGNFVMSDQAVTSTGNPAEFNASGYNDNGPTPFFVYSAKITNTTPKSHDYGDSAAFSLQGGGFS